MSIQLLYVLAVFIPLIMCPLVLPKVVLMAHRKGMTDSPNERKLQNRPVVVMGGTVMMLILCVTFIIINLFYDISILFPVVCAMMIMFVYGMLDDTIGLSWQLKSVIQFLFVILLFFGGSNGVHSLFGLFGIDELPYWVSMLLSIFIGLVIINAVNFVDGIDGLASALGILLSVVMVVWNIKHGFTDLTLLSFAFLGTLVGFFAYNVFSTKYKCYMGDQGSLMLGLFAYISVCPSPYYVIADDLLADRYLFSFFVSLLSAMVFDFFRVILTRIFNGKSPFHADRNHLHHVYVGLGMSHLITTLSIVLSNVFVIAVWYVTAITGMNNTVQFLIVIFAGVLVFWIPYFIIDHNRKHRPDRYSRQVEFFTRMSARTAKFEQFVNNIIDGRRRNLIVRKQE